MIFLLSGEGPSDMGCCKNGMYRCIGDDFFAGPLAIIVQQIVNHEMGKITSGWELSSAEIEFVGHIYLSRFTVPKERPTSSLFRGKKAKREYDGIYFFKEARALGYLAKMKSVKEKCPVASVLFHDADSRRSSTLKLWEEKFESISAGFASIDYPFGVPMVANPTSEAWLLCGLKNDSYTNCSALETFVSASEASERWGKKLVEKARADRNLLELTFGQLVSEGYVNVSRIDMPSFNAFRDRLVEVIALMVPAHPNNHH